MASTPQQQPAADADKLFDRALIGISIVVVLGTTSRTTSGASSGRAAAAASGAARVDVSEEGRGALGIGSIGGKASAAAGA